jgi:hypothetical protein
MCTILSLTVLGDLLETLLDREVNLELPLLEQVGEVGVQIVLTVQIPVAGGG